MSALKHMYSDSFFAYFLQHAQEVVPSLDQKKFLKAIFSSEWNEKELKQRMRHTTLVLHQFLDTDFKKAAKQIEAISNALKASNTSENIFGFSFLPDYIEVFGQKHYDSSIRAIETVTQFVSCEFAIRPFLLAQPNDVMQQMLTWSEHENHHVRRLASEGCRPRLPWAMGIPQLKKNPKPIFPILENMKNDPSEYVRRSVANNLNDISKDHPQLIIDIAAKWKGYSAQTDALIKHGSRTLLKQGNKEILNHFGLAHNDRFILSQIKINTPIVKIGDDLVFEFYVKNNAPEPSVFRLEYAIHYLRQNGTHSKKVFKISEKSFAPNEEARVVKKQSFRIITTRTFYSGVQKLSVILNGNESELLEFSLKH